MPEIEVGQTWRDAAGRDWLVSTIEVVWLVGIRVTLTRNGTTDVTHAHRLIRTHTMIDGTDKEARKWAQKYGFRWVD